jgi:hypothetical protein
LLFAAGERRRRGDGLQERRAKRAVGGVVDGARRGDGVLGELRPVDAGASGCARGEGTLWPTAASSSARARMLSDMPGAS